MKRYTQQELKKLLSGFKSCTPLFKLETKLGRTAAGIVNKMQALSRQNPKEWNPKKVIEYERELSGQYHRQRVINYLKEHHDATAEDIKNAGLGWDLSLAYHHRISSARKDVKVDRRKFIAEKSKKGVIEYLRKYHATTRRELKEAGLWSDSKFAYIHYNITEARMDANIVTPDYVSAAGAARILDVSRQRVSQLFENNRLMGYRLGRSVFISLISVEDRKDAHAIYWWK